MFYWFIKGLFWVVSKLYFRVRILGLENIPKKGPVLLVANHSSFLDPACLGSACPRKVHFLIKKIIHEKFMQKWFYRWMETIPVDEDSADLAAIRMALKRLQRGEVIGIFPEGTRSIEMQASKWMRGVALLAAKSKSVLIPVAIVGTDKALGINKFMPRPLSIGVIFGNPLLFPEMEKKNIKRDDLISFSNLLFESIRDLMNDYKERSSGDSHYERRDYHRWN